MNLQYSGQPIAIPVTEEGLVTLEQDCRAMVLSVLDAILRRGERDPDYAFIDTKLNLLTGEDFPDDDPLRGRNTIYGWIQGRGIEALAEHARWLVKQSDLDQEVRRDMIHRIRGQLQRTVPAMEAIRQAQGGQLPFMMSLSGQRFEVGTDGTVLPRSLPTDRPTSFTDLFYAKGLAAAGIWLENQRWLDDARELFGSVLRDIRTGAFRSDQQPLDPHNPVQPVSGRFSQGPWMIAISGCSLLLEATAEVHYRDLGVECIEHVLKYHANLSEQPTVGLRYDVWEFVDQAGHPYFEGDRLRTDPGHVLEFVGLALKFLRVAEAKGFTSEETDRFCMVLPLIFKQAFETGFSPAGKGIVKGVDLVSREIMHPAMPWWSLPETMRAALEVVRLLKKSERAIWLNMAGQCFNALVQCYVRRDCDLMAVQTIGPDGHPIDSIPATPDVDPAYHTGLSLLDVLGYFQSS